MINSLIKDIKFKICTHVLFIFIPCSAYPKLSLNHKKRNQILMKSSCYIVILNSKNENVYIN
jgi:hypothetical protein